MADYICYEVPEPDFDCGFTDEIVVAELQEEEFFAVMPEIYPNARVDNIEETANAAATAAGNALSAANDAATASGNALSAANSASSTANSAVDTANDALDAASALNTALGNHINSNTAHDKENIPGLKIADTPEFADSNLTPLAAEASYSAAVWTYILGLFTSVPKSAKSHIVKIWEREKINNDRLTILEAFGNEYEKQLTLEGDYVNNAFSSAPLTTFTTVSNRLVLVPFIPKISFNCKEASIAVASGVANSFAKIVIYGSTNKRPYSRLFEGQSFDCSASELKQDATINFNFMKNTLYWIGFHNVGVPSLRANSPQICPKIKHGGGVGNNNFTYIYFSTLYTSGAPANLEGITLNYSSTNHPLINFKVSSLL